jgi:phosphoribosylformylglycinamidine synthase
MKTFTEPNFSDFPRADEADIAGQREALLKSHKINDEEYSRLEKIIGRTPTFAELGVFSSMWSEHCSYKSSRVHLGRFPTESEHVVQGPGENAGVVRIDGKLCAAFKMESHNHPSYIEPYQGAATGVGGILRDVFCMGSRPIANLNCLRFGSRDHKRTPYLFREVVKGIGDYGNCIGVPTVGGTVSFDDTYDGNILVNAMTVGIIHEDRIFKGYATGKGNFVVYLGSATGRDGIHGATMASDSFSSADEDERSTVQVGDPFTEKLLLESTLELLKKNLVVGLQDMGAAGLTSSSFEMASRAGSGLYMDLDTVPVRAENMTAYELLLSESQERMLLVVEPEKWNEVESLLSRWQLSYGIIGCVTDSERVQITYKGRLEVDIPVDPIAENAPKYDRPRKPISRPDDSEQRYNKIKKHIDDQGMVEAVKFYLKETGSKEFIHSQYDSQIGTKTVQGPREEGAAVMWPRSKWSDNSQVGIVVSAACNERYTSADPKLGAAQAVAICARKIAAAGGQPLAITDCLNYGNPEHPEIMEEFSLGVDGISEACEELNTPVVSGNVSLYNETDGVSIAPTPMIGMVGKISDVSKSRPAKIRSNSDIFLMSPKSIHLSITASKVARQLGLEIRAGVVPKISWPCERAAINYLATSSAVSAAREIGDGGILVTLAKLLGDDFGSEWTLSREAAQGLGFATDLDFISEFSSGYLLASDEDISADHEEFQIVRLAKANSSLDSMAFFNDQFPKNELNMSYHSTTRHYDA